MPSEIKGSSNFDSDNAGKVLQVVTVTDSTVVSGTTTLTSAGVSITPSSSSSRILVNFSVALESMPSQTDRGVHTRIWRDGTQIMYQPYTMYLSNDSSQRIGKQTFIVLDSPNTTSAITYTFTGIGTGGSTARMNNYGSTYLTLLEIAG